MRKKRRITILILVACIIASSFNAAAFAASDDAYIYKYDGAKKETSSHRFTFQWMRGDAEWENVRNRYLSANIFQLERTDGIEEISYAYCADFLISIVEGAEYRRVNLEDSTYYNDAAAQHIRAIVDKGYWYDWSETDLASAEKAANEWMKNYEPADFSTDAYLPGDAEEDVQPISDLTKDEALLATQLAIWAFANTEGDNFWVRFYESFTTEEAGVYDHKELTNNVKAFRKYLIHQQSQGLEEEDILFSDQYFVTDAVTFSGKIGESNSYDLTLKVKLAAPIDERDRLELTVAMADRKAESFSLSGEEAIKPGEDGYYSLRLKGVTEEQAAEGVTISISGSQYVNDVYFYEAQPAEGDDARDTSQNLVGKAEGLTPVYAEIALQMELGTQTVCMYKVDNDTGERLEGAEFDLYAKTGDEYLLVFSGLTSDAKGKIQVSDLPEGYEYYFMETRAPEGYEIGKAEYIPAQDVPDGEKLEPVYVANEKEVPDDPGSGGNEGTPDGDTPQTGDPAYGSNSQQTSDDFNMRLYLMIVAAAVLAMAAAVFARRQGQK